MTSLVRVERYERIMATRVGVQVAVEPADEGAATHAAEQCLTWFREVERVLTRFDPASELCRLNATAGRWQPVSSLLFDAVAAALEAAQATGGFFDPTILPALERLGYDRDIDQLATHRNAFVESTVAPDTNGGWRTCAIDRERQRVYLSPGARLDLGGIAKGWAADVALGRFFESFPNVLLDLGGDMRARGGLNSDEPWPLGIGNPRQLAGGSTTAPAVVLTLRNGGLATSGATERWWYHNGQRQHHLMDPRTGTAMCLWVNSADDAQGSRLIASATALAPTAAQAEVAAKVALLRGYPDAVRVVEGAWQGGGDGSWSAYSDSAVALLLILGSGEIVTAGNLRDYLETLGGGGDVWLD